MYVVLCVFVCMLCVLFVRRVLYLRKYKLPPLADGALPLVGHTFAFLVDLEKLFHFVVNVIGEGAKRKGHDVIRLRIGAWNVYVILDIEDGLTVSNACLNKDGIYKFFKPWVGEQGLITADEAIWRRHRRILAPTFSQKILDSFLPEMNKYSRMVVEDLAPYVGREQFDHMEIMKKFSFHTICATAMGTSIDDEDASTKEVYLKCFKEFLLGMTERAQTFWLHSDFIYNLSGLKKKQEYLAKTLKAVGEKVITKRKKMLKDHPTLEDGSPRPKAFLDLLLALSEEETLTDSEIREEVDTFIAAGVDTSATALTYILPILGTYPEVQRRVYEEIKEVFGDSERDVTRDDLLQLKYTEAVIKETLRLYPIVIATGRKVDRDVELKNYVIPAGSRCFPAYYLYLRDPVWGADAAQFVPERWITPGRLPHNHHACAAAFGMGKRACIGMNYSMMNMKTCLVHLLRHYRFTGDVTKLVLKMGIIVSPSSGHWITVDNRKEKSRD